MTPFDTELYNTILESVTIKQILQNLILPTCTVLIFKTPPPLRLSLPASWKVASQTLRASALGKCSTNIT